MAIRSARDEGAGPAALVDAGVADIDGEDAAEGGEAAMAPKPPRLQEPWEAVQPYVSYWLDETVAPTAELPLQYARALVEGARLDELGCLSRLLERRCEGRRDCADLLRGFAGEVDTMVAERYGGAHFDPLRGVRQMLHQMEEDAMEACMEEEPQQE